MTNTIVHGLDGLKALAGKDLGASEWMLVTQDRVNTFADATDDHQWIHVNHDLAAEGPFGRTIAHGYLTAGLLIPLFAEILDVQGVRMGINYGLDRLRFPEPILVGSRIRLRAVLNRVEDVPRGGVQAHLTLTVEIEGTDKPGCIADALYRYYA